ncbi:hypothetical protein TPHA_0K01670 [Tetrapisispora phaffii CBS 4417]|uniref:FYVE-type domain-containing protein n=1 Tax=Tetrapisispora phaffii (strain ATCC 24235 / CBS 4417 / NBRC 1672 / NRRL Y-8282 / UCD 70-5) TaxID=1071381 RepID=G8BZH2_TETPH|nr:hypothetical protein TPHA_0K01670 [Tetrapisispora phaffii CBS 4417]CCE65300.1 hypothetical protein TPHA_0K01670 [Tetrapisispora phaffii CBS 4417]
MSTQNINITGLPVHGQEDIENGKDIGDNIGRLPEITFEKHDFKSSKNRYASGQSVLSNLSFKSSFVPSRINSQGASQSLQTSNPNEDINSSGQNRLAYMTQQIQSPAMHSIRKKGFQMSNDSSSSLAQNNATNSSETSSRNEIGMKEPFTDDNRIENVDSLTRSSLTEIKEKPESPRRTCNVEDDATEDNEQLQKELTQMALKNLSNIKGLNISNAFAGITTQASNLHNSNTENEDGKLSSSHNIQLDNNGINNTSSDSMVHLQFGKKKVYLDSTSQLKHTNPYGMNVDHNTEQIPHTQVGFSPYKFNSIHTSPINKNNHSTDNLTSDNSSINKIGNTNNINTMSLPVHTDNKLTNSISIDNSINNKTDTFHMAGQLEPARGKKYVKQINNPKKPLYIPAVLRNTSETNITNDDVIWSSAVHSTPYKHLSYNGGSHNDGLSTRGSIHSASSHLIETYKKRITSLFSVSSNDNYSTNTQNDLDRNINISFEKPELPTKEHWIADSKRNSCKYCHKLFTFWERKHHCRKCGDIFCQQHLTHWLYLNSDAQYVIGGGSGMGTLSKVCDACAEEYETLIKSNDLSKLKILENGNIISNIDKDGVENSNSSKNSQVKRSINKSFNLTNSGNNAIDINKDDEGDKEKADDIVNSFVGSVPVDWNWSSF